MDQAKTEFADALDFWTGKCGWKKPGLDAVGKKLVDACAISSDDPDQWIVDDYYTFMTRMDFENAKKDWAAKGLTDEGLQAMVDGLHQAGELGTKVIDQLTEDGYKHLMDVVDAELGISKE